MKELASDRLIKAAKPYSSSRIGLSTEDISKIPLTPDIVKDVLACLNSDNASEVGWGLWFAQGILDSSPPKEFLQFLVTKIPIWIAHPNNDVRERSLPILVRLRENFRNYRSLMLNALNDSDSAIRGEALQNYKTFLRRTDIPLLLKFKDDDYMSETSMGSPLIHPRRNQALAVIEELVGRKFSKKENVKAIEDGHTVYWWGWKPFLDWWDGQQKPFWKFWK